MEIVKFLRWWVRFALLPLLSLAFIASAFNMAIFAPLETADLALASYQPLSPILDLSGGWTEGDIRSRARLRENRHQRLLNVSLVFDSGVEIRPTERNVTKNSHVIIYNRVPKCASTTMQHLLNKLKLKNGFSTISSAVFDRQVLSDKDIRGLVAKFSEGKRMVFDRHFYNIEWERYDIEPIRINVVRDPIERLISKFYYLRSPGRWGGSERPPKPWFEKDFESCLFSGDPECQFGWTQELQLTYFCGPEWECGDPNSTKALNKAKMVAETQYSVVGVMENLNESLAVMEAYIPDFFSGAANILPETGGIKKNSHAHPEPSQRTIDHMKKILWTELEFYHFIQQRLNLQLQNIKNNNENSP